MDEYDVVEAWMQRLRDSLDLTGLGEVDVPALLTTVRQVAHTVIHPAGPLAMLAIGYAAARAGGSTAVVEDLEAQVGALARQFVADRATVADPADPADPSDPADPANLAADRADPAVGSQPAQDQGSPHA
jgi:threonine dehydrogenase-like Zn-dependent dehydrogenase